MREIDFKTVGLILTLAVISAWLIRFVAVPQGYMTIPVIPTPIAIPETPQIPKTLPLDILSVTFGFIGITMTPRIQTKKPRELHVIEWLSIIFAVTSIFLSLWGASLLG